MKRVVLAVARGARSTLQQAATWWLLLWVACPVLTGYVACKMDWPLGRYTAGAAFVLCVVVITIYFWRGINPRWAAVVAAVTLAVDWSAALGTHGTTGSDQWSRESIETPPNSEESSATGTGSATPAQRVVTLDDQTRREFLTRQYETGIAEIRQRSQQEDSLFLMKFTLVGAILAALFVLIKKEGEGESERASSNGNGQKPPTGAESKDVTPPPTGTTRDVDQKARTGGQNNDVTLDRLRHSSLVAAFFWASVLVAAIMDTRIHFNVVFIRALGEWVKLLETVNLGESARLGWEHNLELELADPFYPFLRLSSSLLTIVLFAVTVLLLVPGKSMVSKSSTAPSVKHFALAAGFAAFLLFAIVARSFCPNNPQVILHTALWVLIGWGSLALAFVLPPRQSTKDAAPARTPGRP